MANDLIKRPPLRDWIPHSIAIVPEKYKVEHFEVVYPTPGMFRPILILRVSPVEEQPSKWPWQKRRQHFEFWVMDTSEARRSLGKIVEFKRYMTMDSCFYTVNRIVKNP
ncbi:hypothetical protein HY413_00580 [Candidatus Kaiserbacteria bacterium]|nr:hypothetical protein [Candidatus Kaiserbacteria bacterium]